MANSPPLGMVGIETSNAATGAAAVRAVAWGGVAGAGRPPGAGMVRACMANQDGLVLHHMPSVAVRGARIDSVCVVKAFADSVAFNNSEAHVDWFRFKDWYPSECWLRWM